MSRLREFLTVWRLYRAHHSDLYAIRSAWRIAVQGKQTLRNAYRGLVGEQVEEQAAAQFIQ